MRPSIGEETFALHCQCYGLEPLREYMFDPERKFRFDFAFPDYMLAVEVEGGTAGGKGRHSRGVGFENDCIKYNLAVKHGWRVFRYSTKQVTAGLAIDQVREALDGVPRGT